MRTPGFCPAPPRPARNPKASVALAILTICIAALALSCARPALTQANELLTHGEYREARRLFVKALKNNPRSFEAHYGMGMSWCAEALHRTELNLAQPDHWYLAIYHMSRALELRSDSTARQTLAILHFNLAASFHRDGHTDAAIARLSQSLAYDSTQVKTLNLLGALYQQQGNLDNAAECYRRVIALDPRYPMAHYNLGAVAWARQDYAGAYEHFESASRIAPGNAHFSQWSARAKERAAN